MEYSNPEKYKNYWKTAVSEIDQNKVTIRGYPLDEITGRFSYSDVLALCIRGELPNEVESKVLAAVCTACIDHQFLNSTAYASRIVASANPDDPVAALAAGVLAFGKVTAGVPALVVELLDEWYPADESPEALQERAVELVSDFRARKDRIPGFGHPLHPLLTEHYTYRSQIVRDRVEESGLRTDGRVGFYETAHTEFMRQVGRPLPINVDGIIGAALAELGWTPLQATVLGPFTLLPGMAGHVVEEIEHGSPLRIVPDSEYVGIKHRSVADRGASTV